MNPLSYTLLADGSSDRRLVAVVNWTLRHHTDRPISSQWADFTFLRARPNSLRERIQAAFEYFPSDVLFVHRDSENSPRQRRIAEIRQAAAGLNAAPIVEVITVRMQEAWFLFDEAAIRTAAGNPRSKEPLALPRMRDVERLPNPKRKLLELLRRASGLSGRRLHRFRVHEAAHHLATLIEDFTPLQQLKAFREYEIIATAALSDL